MRVYLCTELPYSSRSSWRRKSVRSGLIPKRNVTTRLVLVKAKPLIYDHCILRTLRFTDIVFYGHSFNKTRFNAIPIEFSQIRKVGNVGTFVLPNFGNKLEKVISYINFNWIYQYIWIGVKMYSAGFCFQYISTKICTKCQCVQLCVLQKNSWVITLSIPVCTCVLKPSIIYGHPQKGWNVP